MARALLILAGTFSAAISLLHLAVPVFGAPAYRYFGAGEAIAKAAEERLWWPTELTLGIAVVFLAFSFYAFAGASLVRRPPLLRTGLVAIGLVFTLRGLSFVPQAALWLQDPGLLPGRHVVFSFVALAAGVSCLAGTLAGWRALSLQGG